MNKIQQLKREELAYIAGFLDGDGSINAQIVQRVDYKLKFQIRVTITFYQKTRRHWFVQFLHKKLGCGTIRKRPDGISEYAVVGSSSVKPVLQTLRPYLRIKRRQAVLVLKVIDSLSQYQDRQAFIKSCKLVDQIADLNDSKKRIITANYVRSKWDQLETIVPVETSIEEIEMPSSG